MTKVSILPEPRDTGDITYRAIAGERQSVGKTAGEALDALTAMLPTVVRLFHPRQDRWEEHFRVDTDTGAVVGLTPIGCATVARLQMNTPTQLAARQQWMQLELFP
jgi:hypothetical protein